MRQRRLTEKEIKDLLDTAEPGSIFDIEPERRNNSILLNCGSRANLKKGILIIKKTDRLFGDDK